MPLQAEDFTRRFQTSQNDRCTRLDALQGNPDGNLQQAKI
jgi:hypothetical protein